MINPFILATSLRGDVKRSHCIFLVLQELHGTAQGRASAEHPCGNFGNSRRDVLGFESSRGFLELEFQVLSPQ